MEYIVAKGDLNTGGIAQEVSEKRSCSMLPGDNSYDILVKNMDTFAHFGGSLPEVKVKKFRLRKEISKTLTIDFALWFPLMKRVFIKCSKMKMEKYKIYG